jgi:hypothetical protein
VATVSQDITRVVNIEVQRPVKEDLETVINLEYIEHRRSRNDIFTAELATGVPNSFQSLPSRIAGFYNYARILSS